VGAVLRDLPRGAGTDVALSAHSRSRVLHLHIRRGAIVRRKNILCLGSDRCRVFQRRARHGVHVNGERDRVGETDECGACRKNIGKGVSIRHIRSSVVNGERIRQVAAVGDGVRAGLLRQRLYVCLDN